MPDFYYGPNNTFTSPYKVEPAPNISIQTQLVYGNDTVIGYSYIISINGTALQQDQIGDMRFVTEAIDNIRKIFARNGSDLTIRDGSTNMLRAKGGTLKSITFDNSSNNWTSTAPYQIQIEFNELEVLGETFGCAAGGFLDISTNTIDLIDIDDYKIKDFQDGWTFEVNEATHNHLFGHTLGINNSEIALTYSISATGKNYFTNGNLAPAWMQAKRFVQDRLYDQTRDLSKVLSLEGNSCESTKTLANLHENTAGEGILTGIAYNIYNETLTCSASESDGTFSAEYSCILKNGTSGDYHASNVKHTVNKSTGTTLTGAKYTNNISIAGEITGYCEGGILQNAGAFQFPSTGTILQANSTSTKYSNAASFLSQIIDGDDLTSAFKTDLGITYDELEIPGGDCGDSTLKPVTFNITHNYMNGVITYNAEYNTDRSCVQEFADGTVFSTSIDVEEPVPVLAEFIVPNGNFIIQDIGTVTARKVSVTSQGRKNMTYCYDTDLGAFIEEIATSSISGLFPFLVLPDEEIYTLTTKNFNYNILDGSYTVNLSYICQSGCPL
jgi:hypothetical protein